jgi:hypothetical protein
VFSCTPDVIVVLSLIPYCSDAFPFRPTSLPERQSLRGFPCNTVLALSLTIVPYAVQEWHGGSSICTATNFFRNTPFPGSVSPADRGALRLNSGPYTAPSMLQKFPMQPLPYGPPHAPPQTLFLLDLPANPWPPSFLDRPPVSVAGSPSFLDGRPIWLLSVLGWFNFLSCIHFFSPGVHYWFHHWFQFSYCVDITTQFDLQSNPTIPLLTQNILSDNIGK